LTAVYTVDKGAASSCVLPLGDWRSMCKGTRRTQLLYFAGGL